MGRILILEGPDGGGKTTLAKTLASKHGFNYCHLGPPKKGEDVLHSYALLLDKLHQANEDVVLDRFHLGEAVYGQLFRNRDELRVEGVMLLLRMIHGFDVRVLFVCPGYGTALHNWKNKTTDMVPDENKYRVVYERYTSITESKLYGAPGKWDYEQVPFNYELWKQHILSPRKPLPDGVIGQRNARFLVVGEQANHDDLDLPFISLSGSSHYLFECLKEAGFEESELVFVNAMDLKGKVNDLHTIWNKLNCPIPILLGRKAQVAFDPNHKMTSSLMLPHPAFWKRFRSGKQDEYVAMLAKIRRAVNDGLVN